MHSNCKLALALVAGAAIGGAAIQKLHAQAKPPAFAVVEIDVTNQDAFLKEYSPIAGKALTEAGESIWLGVERMLQSTASRRSREPLSSLLRIRKGSSCVRVACIQGRQKDRRQIRQVPSLGDGSADKLSASPSSVTP